MVVCFLKSGNVNSFDRIAPKYEHNLIHPLDRPKNPTHGNAIEPMPCIIRGTQ